MPFLSYTVHTPKLAITRLFLSLLCKWSNCTGGLWAVWEGKVKDRVTLSLPSHLLAYEIPCNTPALTQTKALLTLLVEGRAERRKGKGWKNRACLQSLFLWHHACGAISQNQEVEVQDSGMQDQTSLCSGLKGNHQHWHYQSCNRNVDIGVFLFYQSTTKSFVRVFLVLLQGRNLERSGEDFSLCSI